MLEFIGGAQHEVEASIIGDSRVFAFKMLFCCPAIVLASCEAENLT